MSIQIDAWADFLCPFCYLMTCTLDALQSQYAMTLRWRAYELRPPGSPPLTPARRQHILTMRPKFSQMAQEQFGLQLKPGPIGISSRPALVAAKAAEAHGVGGAFHTAVMHAYWRDGYSIDRRDLLIELAVNAGLNAGTFAATFDNPDFEAVVAADLALAHARKVHSIPTLLINNQRVVHGARPHNELASLIQEMAAANANTH